MCTILALRISVRRHILIIIYIRLGQYAFGFFIRPCVCMAVYPLEAIS